MSSTPYRTLSLIYFDSTGTLPLEKIYSAMDSELKSKLFIHNMILRAVTT
jgi:hypothetical protein